MWRDDRGFLTRSTMFSISSYAFSFPFRTVTGLPLGPGSVQACLGPSWAANGVLPWNVGQGPEHSSIPWDLLARVGEKKPTWGKLFYDSAQQLQSTVFHPLVPIYWATNNAIYVMSLIHTITWRGSNGHLNEWSEWLKRLSSLLSAAQLFSSKLRNAPSPDSHQSPTWFY